MGIVLYDLIFGENNIFLLLLTRGWTFLIAFFIYNLKSLKASYVKIVVGNKL